MDTVIADDQRNPAVIPDPSEGEFGQVYSLLSALHKLVRDYPLGVGLFKEFIQNADDAGATEIQFILAKNDFSNLAFHNSKLKCLAGPSLLIWNNAPFKTLDIENIQSLGDSQKVRKPSNTGKFGLGFNTCYNITDYPQLLTGDNIFLFDPHKSAYDYLNKNRPGYRWRLTPERWSDSPGLLKPFEVVGLSPNGTPFLGSAFRLPLRTPTHNHLNEGGKIKTECVSPEKIEDLMQEFSRLAPSILIFLKHVLRIEFLITGALDGSARRVLEISTLNQDEVRSGRDTLNNAIKSDFTQTLQDLRALGQEQESIHTCFKHSVVISAYGQETNYDWLVSAGLFRGANNGLLDAAGDLLDRGEKVIPWAGVAGLIPLPTSAIPPDFSGEVFCFLPLPDVRGSCQLPVHINGFFDVDTSRRSLTHEAAAKGSIERLRGQWNQKLLMEGVASAYVQMLVKLLQLQPEISPDRFYQLWLNPDQNFPPPLDALSRALYARLSTQKLLRSAGSTWVAPADLRLVDPELRLPLVAEKWDKVAEPELQQFILNGFCKAGAAIHSLRVSELRVFLQESRDVDCAPANSARPALQKRDWLISVASFALKDAKPSDCSGLPLLLLADGTLHTFGLFQRDVYLAGEPEREIFLKNPEWFVDAEYALRAGLKEVPPLRVLRMRPEHVLTRLANMIPQDPGCGYATWKPKADEPPNEPWLRRVYSYFLAQPPSWNPDKNLLHLPCIVPDQNQKLWPCGNSNTPLYIPSELSIQLRTALENIDVQVVSGEAQLLIEIEAFIKRFGRIWSVSPCDLADTLLATKTSWSLRVPKYDSAICDPMLRFFSSDEALNSLQSPQGGRLDAVGRLPIFPCQNDGLIAIKDHQCFIVTDVSPPNVPLQVKLVRPGDWKSLLMALDVKPLGAKEIIADILLAAYPNLSQQDQLTALAWIRDQLETALTEAGAEGPVLLRKLESAKLVVSSHGEPSTCGDLYDPNIKIIAEVLGGHAVTPCRELYEQQWNRWHLFFKRLGLNQTPQPQGIANYISTLIRVCPIDENTEVKLTSLLHHLVQHWANLKTGQIVTNDGVKVTFADFLRHTRWCPPLRGERNLRHLLVAHDPPLQLFKLAELFPPSVGHLVASVRHLLPIEQRDSIPTAIRELVPEVITPPLLLVASNFANLLASLNRSGFQLDQKSIKTPLQRIYTYFGRIHRRNQPVLPATDDESSNLEFPPEVDDSEFEAVQRQFAEVQCIYVESQNRFRQAKDTFRVETSYASNWWSQSSFVSHDVEGGLTFLGRQEKPGFSDFCRLTREVNAVSGEEPLDQMAAEQFLHVLVHLNDSLPAQDQLPEIYLLDRENFTVRSSNLFFYDATWLDDKLKDCPVRLHHPQLPIGLVVRLKLRRLSEYIRTEPEGEWPPSLDAEFVSRCRAIAKLLKSSEFENGMRRILLRNNLTDQPNDLRWLARMEISPFESLECSHHIDDGEQHHEIARGAELFFNERTESGEYRVSISEAASEVLYEQVATAIQRIIGPNQLTDLCPLAKILQYAPDRIDAILDKLRVPRLDISVPLEAEQITADGESDFSKNTAGGGLSDTPVNTEYIPNENVIGGRAQSSTTHEAPSDGTIEKSGQERNNEPIQQPGIYPRGRSLSRSWPSRTTGTHKRSFSSTEAAPKGRLISYPATSATKIQYERECDHGDDELPINHEIGKWAVHWVLQYERQHGRNPRSMAHNNPGYDVESGVPTRYIEVKGIGTQWDRNGVPISPRQFEFAQARKEQFWLYIVEFATDHHKVKINPIQNPVSKITQYRFDNGWDSEKITESPFITLFPTVGRRIQWYHGDELRNGVIINDEGKILQVRLENGHQTGVVYRPLEVEILS